MPLSKPRMLPLKEDEWTREARADLDRYARGSDGRVLNVFATLARHPKLLKRWMVFANHILFKSTLPARDRELLILRTAWLCGSEYEWGQHSPIARSAGLDPGEIRRIARGPEAPGWSPFDRTLLEAAGELHRDRRVGDVTWRELRERYDTRQLLDAVFTVGQYQLLAMALNSLGVARDDGVPGFPP